VPGSLNDDELLVGLMRLAALPGVRDGHTGIFPLDPGNRRVLHAYPTRFYTVLRRCVRRRPGRRRRSSSAHAWSRSPGIHSTRCWPQFAHSFPHDNDATLALRETTYLNTPEVLHGLQLVPGLGPVRFTFERDGKRFDQDLAPMTVDTYERLIGDLVHPLIPQGIAGRIPRVRHAPERPDLDDDAFGRAHLLRRLQRGAGEHRPDCAACAEGCEEQRSCERS
jgi:hypothetical protein